MRHVASIMALPTTRPVRHISRLQVVFVSSVLRLGRMPMKKKPPNDFEILLSDHNA
jgi:hypothetical protein